MASGLIGLVTGGALGFAANKYREKEQQKLQVQQMTLKGYMDDAENTPEVVNNPEWEKAFRKSMGDSDAADAAMMHFKIHAAERSRQQEQAMKLITGIMGGGPPAPQGTPPVGSQASPSGQGQPAAPATAPTTAAAAAASPTAAPEDFDGQLQKLTAAKAMIPSLGLPPDHSKAMESSIDALIKNVEEKRKEGASKERQQAGFSQQEKMQKERVAGEEKLLGERKGMEKELIDLREKATEKATKFRETIAASKAADKPWTPKDSMAARKSALEQAKAELTATTTETHWFKDPTTKAVPPSGAAVRTRSAEILASEGLNPETGQKLTDGEHFDLNGRRLIWRDAK